MHFAEYARIFGVTGAHAVKRIILVAAVATACLIALAVFLVSNARKHTVGDFSRYPCAYDQADEIEIRAPGRAMTLARSGAQWMLTAPRKEHIDDGALAQFNIFMSGRFFIDAKIDVDARTRKDYESPIPTHVSFKKNGAPLCAFELGKSVSVPSADDERRWVFPDATQTAVRTFVPLIDYGKLLEQPTFGWRMKKVFESDAPIDEIEIITPNESYSLGKGGEKTANNSAGWRIFGIKTDGNAPPPEALLLDIDRVATMLSLLSPLYVDDFAFDIAEDERQNIVFAGKIRFKIGDALHTLEIGTPADLTRNPQWLYYGEGTRYVRFGGNPDLGIMSAQRIAGIFPSISDLRSKEVWQLDTSKFSSIEIEQPGNCLRYRPSAPDVWTSAPCGAAGAGGAEIPNRELALFVKTLTALKAVRFITDAEQDDAAGKLNPPDTVIRIFEGTDNVLNKTLQLSEKRKSLFRYARIIDENSKSATPIFVIDENMASLLLRNAGKADAKTP